MAERKDDRRRAAARGDPLRDRDRLVSLPHPRAGLGDDGRRGPDPGLHPGLSLDRDGAVLRRSVVERRARGRRLHPLHDPDRARPRGAGRRPERFDGLCAGADPDRGLRLSASRPCAGDRARNGDRRGDARAVAGLPQHRRRGLPGLSARHAFPLASAQRHDARLDDRRGDPPRAGSGPCTRGGSRSKPRRRTNPGKRLHGDRQGHRAPRRASGPHRGGRGRSRAAGGGIVGDPRLHGAACRGGRRRASSR